MRHRRAALVVAGEFAAQQGAFNAQYEVQRERGPPELASHRHVHVSLCVDLNCLPPTSSSPALRTATTTSTRSACSPAAAHCWTTARLSAALARLTRFYVATVRNALLTTDPGRTLPDAEPGGLTFANADAARS